MNKIEFQGKTYQTQREACRAFGITPRLFCQRQMLGWDLEKILTTPSAEKQVKVGRLTFKNMSTAARHFGLSLGAINHRLLEGQTIEEAFEQKARIKPPRAEPKKYTDFCDGKVYIIRNSVNKMVYIGVTSNSVSSRFFEHKRSVQRGSTTALHKAMYELGVENFRVKQIDQTDSREHLDQLERFYINKYRSRSHGYNLKVGGGLGGSSGFRVQHGDLIFPSIASFARHMNMNETAAKRIVTLL